MNGNFTCICVNMHLHKIDVFNLKVYIIVKCV